MKIKKSTIILLCFMAIFFIRGLYLINYYSVTEEAGYIANGYTLFHTGDFIITETHPHLLHLISAVPLLFMDTKWEMYPAQYRDNFINIQWVYADRFVFFIGNNADTIMTIGRMPVLLLSLLLMVYLFTWSKELFGNTAGIISLILFTFEPNVIGYSAVLMDDMPVAVFTFISAYYFWKSIHSHERKDWMLFGMFTGFAFCTKFNSLMIVPVYLLIGFLILRKTDYKVYWKHIGASLLIILLIINCSYFFQGFLSPIGKEQMPLSPLHILNSPALSWIPSPVPTYFLMGLEKSFNLAGVDSQVVQKTYFMGEMRENPWAFHIMSLLLKTPIALLILFIVGVGLSLANQTKFDKKLLAMCVLIPAIIIFFFSLGTYKLGIRHILFSFPFMILVASSIVTWKGFEQKIYKYITYALLAWFVIASLIIHPDHLSYFNEFIGGPNNADKYFIESNIDLGQNLKALMTWMKENKVEGLYLSHYGHDFPQYRQINYATPPCGKLMPGWTAVSLNHIHGYMFTGQPLDCYTFLQNVTPTKKIGYSLYLYYTPQN